MPPRSIWKGFLKLSLISVPVKAYSASASGTSIRLNQLHQGCHSPVKYQKVCPIHGELENDAVVSGYEYSKGQYVEIDPEELQKLRTRSEKAITIDGFLQPKDIDPLYYGPKTYYLVADGPVGEKPYRLLHEAMVEEGVYAVAQVVLSRKERLVLLRPYGRLLTMTTLYLTHEVKMPESFGGEVVVDRALSDGELDLAKRLIEAWTMEDFDLGRYKDAYREKLTELIEAKVEGKEIFRVPTPQEPEVLNLLEALKESVAKAQEKPTGKMAAVAEKTVATQAKKRVASSARKRARAKRKRHPRWKQKKSTCATFASIFP